jgi:hypothetical protein
VTDVRGLGATSRPADRHPTTDTERREEADR